MYWGQKVESKREDAKPLALKIEERATNQAIQVATGNRRRQGNQSSSRVLEIVQPWQHPDFDPVKPSLDFWPPEL